MNTGERTAYNQGIEAALITAVTIKVRDDAHEIRQQSETAPSIISGQVAAIELDRPAMRTEAAVEVAADEVVQACLRDHRAAWPTYRMSPAQTWSDDGDVAWHAFTSAVVGSDDKPAIVGRFLGVRLAGQPVPAALSQTRGVYPALTIRPAWRLSFRRQLMILSAIAAKLKQRAKGDFKGRHYKAALVSGANSRAKAKLGHGSNASTHWNR